MIFHFRGTPVFLAGLLAITAMLSWAAAAQAENEGQDDLDKAFDKKLAAKEMSDLGEVVDLCDSAIQKGLDAGNTASANNLLVGTLMQRANLFTKAILDQTPGWAQLRIQAVSDLEKAIKIDPKMAPAYLSLARLQSLPGGDRAAAVKAAEKAVECSKDEPELKVDALLMQANLSDNPEKTLDLFSQALKIAPNNASALRERGMFLFLAGKTDDALADLDAAAKADPENAEVQEARGSAFLKLKRPDDAIKAYSELIKIAADSPLPYLLRASVYAQQKKTKEAVDDIEQALKKDSTKAIKVKALLLRAQVHQQAGDAKAARADLDEALKERPALDVALEWRAVLAANSGDYRQAIEDFEGLRKLAPKNPDLLSELGMLYDRNKQPRKAIDVYADALTIRPEHYLALRGQADAYLNIGKHAEAVTDYDAALKLKPDDTELLNNFAWVLATSPDDSVRDGKRAIELGTQAAKATDYKQAHILSTLAAGYAESGDFDKAREWSQKAVDLGTEDADTNAQLKKELASYESKKPWRERQVTQENESDSSKGAAKDKPEEKSSTNGDKSVPPKADSSAANDASTKKE